MSQNNLIPSSVVMAFFGYTNRSSFWGFVRTKGVPHIRLNQRRIMFHEESLNSWLRKRDTSGNPRLFKYEPPQDGKS